MGSLSHHHCRSKVSEAWEPRVKGLFYWVGWKGQRAGAGESADCSGKKKKSTERNRTKNKKLKVWYRLQVAGYLRWRTMSAINAGRGAMQREKGVDAGTSASCSSCSSSSTLPRQSNGQCERHYPIGPDCLLSPGGVRPLVRVHAWEIGR